MYLLLASSDTVLICVYKLLFGTVDAHLPALFVVNRPNVDTVTRGHGA